ncbi:MAG: TetR/AcrR family transcriptional regulator [Chloroflexota bacterium]
MPYPSQVDAETIVKTAREMIENEGAEKLSLRVLAKELGIKAPSLYRHVGSKDGLVKAVNELTMHAMVAALENSLDREQPITEQLMSIGHAYRAFATKNPACYTLAYNSPRDATRPDPAMREALVLPVQALFGQLVGEEQSFAAIRGAYAMLHGWVMLEILQQFERGGDLDAHFEQALRAYLAGWSA